MAAKYIFRLDDISWDMNYEKFCRIRELFFRYQVKPLIGVIPQNRDIKLMSQVGERHLSEEQFWSMVRELQDNHGWDIALHGYDHVYVTDDSGIFGINPRAEFAGVPIEEQCDKITKGKSILLEQGLNIKAFMAPAHSLDWNTVEALKQNDITVITDGNGLFPYREREMLFIPAQWSILSRKTIGVHTFCIHVNSWQEKHFVRLERFLKKHKSDCITFSQAIDQEREGKYLRWQGFSFLSEHLVLSQKKAFQFIAKHLRG